MLQLDLDLAQLVKTVLTFADVNVTQGISNAVDTFAGGGTMHLDMYACLLPFSLEGVKYKSGLCPAGPMPGPALSLRPPVPTANQNQQAYTSRSKASCSCFLRSSISCFNRSISASSTTTVVSTTTSVSRTI